MSEGLPVGPYDIVYADPPWNYKINSVFGGAGTHYRLMSDADLLSFPVRSLMADRSVLFLWATCPRLDFAIQCISAWGLHYRGVAFVWVKTSHAGVPLGATGGPRAREIQRKAALDGEPLPAAPPR